MLVLCYNLLTMLFFMLNHSWHQNRTYSISYTSYLVSVSLHAHPQKNKGLGTTWSHYQANMTASTYLVSVEFARSQDMLTPKHMGWHTGERHRYMGMWANW